MKKISLITFIFMLFLVSCTSTKERMEYSSHIPLKDSWDDILTNPVDINVKSWNTGKLEVNMKGLIDVNHPNASHLEKSKAFVDVPLYMFERDSKFYFVDTGLDRDFEEDKTKNVNGLLAPVIILGGTKNNATSLVDIINNENITPDGIFLTHMHFDHTAGLADLEIDVPLIAGKGEEPIEVPLLFRANHLDNISTVNELDFSQSKEVYPFDRVIDIFGDSSVFAISTNGHTAGHVCYLINSTKGIYLLTGDQLNIPENIELNVGPGNFSSDVEVANEFFEDLMAFISLYPETNVLMGHHYTEVN